MIVRGTQANEPSHYYTIEIKKLLIMTILIFNFYEFYWFYKNWEHLKYLGKKCSPLRRTILSPITSYSLFRQIKNSAKQYQIKNYFFPVLLAIIYFSSGIFVQLNGWYSLLSLCNLIPILFANNLMMKINSQKGIVNIDNKIRRFDLIILAIPLSVVLLGILKGFIT